MAVRAFRASCVFILPLPTSKHSAPLPLLHLLSRASLFRWVPPHKAPDVSAQQFHWWIQLVARSN